MIRGKTEIPIGEGLVRLGVLTPTQRDNILSKQKRGDPRLFGEIAVESNFVSKETVNNYMKDITGSHSSRRR